MSAYHLIVLVHGIWGNSSHMEYMASQIEQHCTPTNPKEKIVVYKTGSHSGYLTYDGVDLNGKRITDEILEQVELLGPKSIAKFSMVGYSLGGLVARYSLGLLYSQGFFSQIKPVHFVTFCTPHVGALNPRDSISSRAFNLVAPYVLAHTGKHMFLKDKERVGEGKTLPLLQWMADPKSPFFKALEAFEDRTIYCNTINDRRTSWYTTSISNVDPFHSMVNENMSAYALEYVPGYAPTVIDFAKPIEFRRVERPNKDKFSFMRFLIKTYFWSKLIVSTILLAPLYLLYSLSNAIWQRVMLSKRVASFSKESADSLEVLYKTVGDTIAYEFGNDENEKFKESDKYKEDSENSSDNDWYEESEFGDIVRDQTDSFVDSIFDALNSASYYDYHYSIVKPKGDAKTFETDTRKVVDLRGKAKTNFKVKLTDSQEAIVTQLNKLKWNKYPVIIRNTKATHAAVINRHPDPHFDEGKVVIEHFIKNVLTV